MEVHNSPECSSKSITLCQGGLEMKRIAFAALAVLLGSVAGARLSMAADDIKIGTSAPLTGPQAFFGTTWQNGMKLYFDEINAKGGIKGRKISLVQLDDKADPKEGTLVAQKFCDDKGVIAVIGHFNSCVTIPTMDVYSGCGMPQVCLSSNPKITEMSYKHIFQLTPNDYAQGAMPANYLYKTLGLRKVAVVNDKQAFGQGVSQVFEQTFKKLGGTVTSVSGVNYQDVDFSALISALKLQNPDVIYMGAVMPQLSLFVKQMHEQGLTAVYITPDGGFEPDFIKQAGGAAEGALVSFQTPPYDSTPELKNFSAQYEKKFTEKPGPYSAYGWVDAQVVTTALEAASSLDRQGVMAALRNTKMKTILGTVSFDQNGKLEGGGEFLYKVVGNDFKLIYTEE